MTDEEIRREAIARKLWEVTGENRQGETWDSLSPLVQDLYLQATVVAVQFLDTYGDHQGSVKLVGEGDGRKPVSGWSREITTKPVPTEAIAGRRGAYLRHAAHDWARQLAEREEWHRFRVDREDDSFVVTLVRWHPASEEALGVQLERRRRGTESDPWSSTF